jgi:UDP-N-acetylglucosamine 1-carboxyvinyltransferase
MKSFIAQIRDAIEASGVTRYALAEQTGLSESILSRFMSGKQNMSLATVDKIAEALGLEVIVGVQNVQKSRKPGRPEKKKPKMEKLKKTTRLAWELVAVNAAKDAHENNFPSRRGIYVIEDVGIVYYDNNPYELPREKDPREKLLSQFRDFLKSSKLKEKASAYWPPNGDDKDYTFAMVIEAQEFMFDAIRVAFQDIVATFVRGMYEIAAN